MTKPPFSVELTRAAEKDLRGYRGSIDQVVEELSKLERDPMAGHSLQGSLRGVRALEFSMADGEHRAVYVVLSEDSCCLVFLIGPHENIYRMAERRYQALKRSGAV